MVANFRRPLFLNVLHLIIIKPMHYSVLELLSCNGTCVFITIASARQVMHYYLGWVVNSTVFSRLVLCLLYYFLNVSHYVFASAFIASQLNNYLLDCWKFYITNLLSVWCSIPCGTSFYVVNYSLTKSCDVISTICLQMKMFSLWLQMNEFLAFISRIWLTVN